MSRRKKWIAAILAVVVIVGCFIVFSRPLEPHFEGRSLTYWAARLDQPEGKIALTAIGTNALPYLIEWLDEEPTRFSAWVRNAGDRLPISLRPNPWSFESRRDIASNALGFLGTNAIPAIPDLIRTYDWDRELSGGIPPSNQRALAEIGAAAIPGLMKALDEDPKRYDAVVRTIVYMEFRKLRSPQDLRAIVAALDHISGHPAKAVRLSVASQLMRLEDREEIHEEVCLVWEKLLRDESSDVRTAAVEGAVRLLPGSSQIDLLVPLRDDPHPNVRNAVERVLQRAGRLSPMPEPVALPPKP